MNSSTSKRHKGYPQNNNNGSDRLSELPDGILVHILSFMPILDAVRTVAIRRFGSLWTQLPFLDFVESEFAFNCDDDDDIYAEELTLRFANFVRNVVILHKRVPIECFKLSFDCNVHLYFPINRPIVQESTAWIRFAIDRQVKNLCLHSGVNVDIVPTSLPSCVFTSQFLETLKLDTFRIIELSRVRMRSLTRLSLHSVEVSNEVLNKIILGSPSLREMDLHHVLGLTELCFTAPNIQKLRLVQYNGLLDCPNLKVLGIDCIGTFVQVVDVSSIREVTIRYEYDFNASNEFWKKFCHAKVFRYVDGELPYFEQDFLQTKWKCLHIKSMLHGDQLLAICSVLGSSPLVEELVVYTYSKHWDGACDKGMLSLELPSCLMQQLKTVTMRGYEISCHGLLRLADQELTPTRLLACRLVGHAQHAIEIPQHRGKDRTHDLCHGDVGSLPPSQTPTPYELKFVKQLLSFPRASTNARVIFGSEACDKVE